MRSVARWPVEVLTSGIWWLTFGPVGIVAGVGLGLAFGTLAGVIVGAGTWAGGLALLGGVDLASRSGGRVA